MIKKMPVLPILYILLIVNLSCVSAEFSRYQLYRGSLAQLINRYRSDVGLTPIPISPSLTRVAQLHVNDLQDNFKPSLHKWCNMHSWSDKGDWTSCCYTDDHREAECMWRKPRELTSYRGNGFEIAASIHGTLMTPAMALDIWKGSTGHHNVIVNKGPWSRYTWKAMGAAMSRNYAVVWFGKEPDKKNR